MRPHLDPWSGLILLACTFLAIALIIIAAASTSDCQRHNTCEVRR